MGTIMVVLMGVGIISSIARWLDSTISPFASRMCPHPLSEPFVHVVVKVTDVIAHVCLWHGVVIHELLHMCAARRARKTLLQADQYFFQSQPFIFVRNQVRQMVEGRPDVVVASIKFFVLGYWQRHGVVACALHKYIRFFRAYVI